MGHRFLENEEMRLSLCGVETPVPHTDKSGVLHALKWPGWQRIVRLNDRVLS